jgi:hypothetical protein
VLNKIPRSGDIHLINHQVMNAYWGLELQLESLATLPPGKDCHNHWIRESVGTRIITLKVHIHKNPTESSVPYIFLILFDAT